MLNAYSVVVVRGRGLDVNALLLLDVARAEVDDDHSDACDVVHGGERLHRFDGFRRSWRSALEVKDAGEVG